MSRRRNRPNIAKNVRTKAAATLAGADPDRVATTAGKIGRFLDKGGEVAGVVFPRIGGAIEKSGEVLNNQSDRIGNAVAKGQALQAQGQAASAQRQPPKAAQTPKLAAAAPPPQKASASSGAAIRVASGSGSAGGTAAAAMTPTLDAPPESGGLFPAGLSTGSKLQDAGAVVSLLALAVTLRRVL